MSDFVRTYIFLRSHLALPLALHQCHDAFECGPTVLLHHTPVPSPHFYSFTFPLHDECASIFHFRHPFPFFFLVGLRHINYICGNYALMSRIILFVGAFLSSDSARFCPVGLGHSSYNPARAHSALLFLWY